MMAAYPSEHSTQGREGMQHAKNVTESFRTQHIVDCDACAIAVATPRNLGRAPLALRAQRAKLPWAANLN